ncbi:MAG: TIGR03986 family CRISPR-associated RAMP protein [Acidobacteria bacterium]|nr:TIGR03986 family CRISPR-associated RAMP protein [Acidobacteriota bacterium]
MSNQKRFTHYNPTRPQRTARAPYNFVPLPEEIITVEQDKLPKLNSYQTGTHTGWFDCELVTCSPIYVRGMMTHAQHKQYDPQEERKLTEAEEINRKEERAGFYAPDPAQMIEGRPAPAIPGSSLRGLIRALIEIAGYGKMRWVNDDVKITFRAVAASREDPLAEPYRKVIGQFSRNVLAGYLHRTQSGDWGIQPARKPKDKGWPEQAAYLKVKDVKIPSEAIDGFRRFDHRDYWPDWFEVSYNAVSEKSKGRAFVRVTQIGDPQDNYQYRGVLVCTGNMVESGGADSPRRNHTLVLEEDKSKKALPIASDLLRAYRETMTPFQRDEIWPEAGLEEGAPVFYVTESDRVAWFGHTPNFRIPARKANGEVATLKDFIPSEMRRPNNAIEPTEPDLAEAIFGWVGDDKEGNPTEFGADRKLKATQRAGRVSFTDARYEDNQHGVWYDTAKSTIPMPLSTPKITTFQHYLVQDKDKGHDPDLRGSLAHYGAETEIRGHKLYWHKGNARIKEAEADTNESQLTRIHPVKAGVRFRLRVHFENLRDYELGALAWALTLPPGEAGQRYCHKLGMGKPLGMGSVAITATLHLTERSQRYARLFERGSFFTGANTADAGKFICAFESYVLGRIPETAEGGKFTKLERMQMLLTILQWREWDKDWAERTRYLEIEHPKHDNEYKDRPVLPDPLFVSGERVTPQAPNPLFTEEKLGRVVELPANRSFGYLNLDGVPGKIFFHFSQLVGGGRLQRDQRVRCKIREGPRGPEAYDVRLAE